MSNEEKINWLVAVGAGVIATLVVLFTNQNVQLDATASKALNTTPSRGRIFSEECGGCDKAWSDFCRQNKSAGVGTPEKPGYCVLAARAMNATRNWINGLDNQYCKSRPNCVPPPPSGCPAIFWNSLFTDARTAIGTGDLVSFLRQYATAGNIFNLNRCVQDTAVRKALLDLIGSGQVQSLINFDKTHPGCYQYLFGGTPPPTGCPNDHNPLKFLSSPPPKGTSP